MSTGFVVSCRFFDFFGRLEKIVLTCKPATKFYNKKVAKPPLLTLLYNLVVEKKTDGLYTPVNQDRSGKSSFYAGNTPSKSIPLLC